MFNQFYGEATIGGVPAADGTLIEARVQWWRSDPSTVYQGKYSNIIVTPNDWALNGKIVTFHTGELQALETAIYNGRTFQLMSINLTFP